ncbi:MAG: PEP-CTERM sorting domain-containing protein [Deltaproteobacteria bacterium]|nr:PEP-CTERM sorting domain-containing protein [Deltaproteobacteria bacterium]
MLKRFLGLLALVFCLVPGTGRAAPIFSDNFNVETLGVNYNSFLQWTVTNGTVDLIGNPNFFDLLPGNGRYVDLDGTARDPGVMRSGALSLVAGVTYELKFSLAGSQRGDAPNTVTYGIDLNSDGALEHFGSQTLPSAASFSVFTLTFTPGANTNIARIQFGQTDVGATDDIGLILDNVELNSLTASVPEPASLLLLGAAAIYGLARWRRKPVR